MASIELQIPDYFTVNHFQQYEKFTSFDPIDQMVAVTALLTYHTEEEIKNWPAPAVVQAYKAVSKMVRETQPEFYPVIEWQGTLYGYRPLSKMTMAEYIDLDSLSKDANKNLTQLLAILYRPVTRNDLKNGKFITKTFIKSWAGKVEDPFKYYDIEEYSSETRQSRADSFKDFPVSVALGGISFFLGTALSLSPDSKTSFLSNLEMITQIPKRSRRQSLSLNITGGYSRSKTWESLPSFRSLVINPS